MKKTAGILRIAFAVCVALAAILQAIAVLTSYDTSSNYFPNGTVLPTVAVLFALLGALCGTVSARMTDPAALNTTPFSDRPSTAPAAIGFLAAAIFLPLYGSHTASPKLAIVAAIFLVAGMIQTVLSNLPSMRKKKANVIVFLGFAAIISFILVIGYYYFDISVEMNAPFKVSTQMGLLCAMLYFTGEIRYLLGVPMPRMYLTLSSWLISIGALSALSVPLAFFTGKTDRADYAAGAILVLCALLTALVRVNTLLHPPVSEGAPEADDESNRKDPT